MLPETNSKRGKKKNQHLHLGVRHPILLSTWTSMKLWIMYNSIVIEKAEDYHVHNHKNHVVNQLINNPVLNLP